MSQRVVITEVGARDGLQNERAFIPTSAKLAFIKRLVEAGSRQIEVGSFVHPTWVPAMADTDELFQLLERAPGVRYLALVPNARGYERARRAGCDAVAVFTAASEGFARANINTTIAQSLDTFRGIAGLAGSEGVAVRGYVSTAFACPFDGPTAPERVVPIAEALLAMGCYEVSLGDTIGIATPAHVDRLLSVVLKAVPADRVVMHFHDTWGMGVANVLRALDFGIRRFDASAGGLGGCPFAKSATGNVATEDIVYLLENLGYATGLDLEGIVAGVELLQPHLDHLLPSRVHRALRGKGAAPGN